MIREFTRESNKGYSIHPLEEKELDEVAALCDECVGKNLYPKEEIGKAIGSKERFFYLLKTAEGKIAGYLYYYLTDVASVARYAKLDINQFLDVYANEKKPVGKIQSIGLKEEYRGLGLATQMMQFLLKELELISVEAAFIVCWKIGNRIPLEKTLCECDFAYLTEAKRVWYDDINLVCPYCKGRCTCDAEVYYKMLGNGGLK